MGVELSDVSCDVHGMCLYLPVAFSGTQRRWQQRSGVMTWAKLGLTAYFVRHCCQPGCSFDCVMTMSIASFGCDAIG